MARGGTTKILIWILMAMLILGLGGFGVINLSGSVRTVGSVGEEKISVQQYGRALQEELRNIEARTGQRLSLADAQARGIDKGVLGQLIGAAALDNEARQIGLSMGDEILRRQILQIPGFKGPDGKFDRESYKFALSQTGLSESEFEDEMRRESARSLLQGAIIAGASMPETYLDTLMGFIAERRNFTWAVLDANTMPVVLLDPTEEQLIAYHDNHKSDFTTPAMKKLTYVWLTPDMLLDKVEVDDASIVAQYEANKAEYMRPERRLVERLAFADTEAASAAKARIETGETDFEAIVTERGLQLSDIDLGDVTKEELDAAGGAVFNAAVGDVVGPFDTNLGPALFRVNGILAAQETSLEDARQEIRDDLAADRARRQIETVTEQIDDLLAGGATLEELVTEAHMQLATLDWHADADAPVNGFAAFRDAAEAVAEGDYPQVIRLDDGGIAALRMEGIVDPRLQPLDEVRDAVIEGWKAEQTATALKALADDLVTQLATTGDMAALGLTAQVETGVTRQQFVTGAPAGFLTKVFEMNKGDVAVVAGDQLVTIVRLDDVLAPDADNPDVQMIRKQLSQDVAASLAQDLYAAYASEIQARAGIMLDQAAINAVHANFQ